MSSSQCPIFYKLHISPVLPADFKECLCDLSDGAIFRRFHDAVENILVMPGPVLEVPDQRWGDVAECLMQMFEHRDLVFLLFLRRPDDLPGGDGR